MAGSNGHVVKDTESGGAVRLGMVPRRADKAEGTVQPTVQNMIDGMTQASGCQAGDIVRLFRGVRVGIKGDVKLTAGPCNPIDVGAVVYPFQFFRGSETGRNFKESSRHFGGLQHPVDGLQSCRRLRMGGVAPVAEKSTILDDAGFTIHRLCFP